MPGRRVRRQPVLVDATVSTEYDDSTESDIGLSTDRSACTKRHSASQLCNAKCQRCVDSTDYAVISSPQDAKKSRTARTLCKQSVACTSKDLGNSSDATFPNHLQLSDDMLSAALGQRLLSTFFDQPCVQLARDLLGKYLVCIPVEDGRRLSGKIVETEAYVGTEDRASHSYGGKRTARNEAMYMPPGTSYVYNIYGIYTCINISSRGDGTAVLIRALEPTEGLDTMQKNRGLADKGDKVKPHDLCSGPSKLTKALNIVKSNGDQVDLATCSYLWLEDGLQVPNSDIISCSRIGIGNYAKEWTDKPLRFYVRGCRSVSIRCKAAEGATNH